jgi:hypothetical protein
LAVRAVCRSDGQKKRLDAVEFRPTFLTILSRPTKLSPPKRTG